MSNHPIVGNKWWQANRKRHVAPVLTRIALSPTTLRAHPVASKLPVGALPRLRLLTDRSSLASMLLTSTRHAAHPVYRLLNREHLTKIGLADLGMEEIDVESFLLHYGVQPSESVVRAVLEHSPGWAFRRQLAVLSTRARASSMNATIPQPRRRAFIDLRPEPSVLDAAPVAAAAFHPLAQREPDAVASATGDVERWRTSGSRTLLASQVLKRGGEWPSAARDPVRSLSVSRVLAGAGGDVVRHAVELPEFGEGEPLLLAAAAIENSWLEVAESALNRAESELALAGNAEATDLLSVALVRMALTCHRGDAVGGLAAATCLRELMEGLKPFEDARAPELPALIDYYVAGCEWSMGRLDTARSTLQTWAGSVEPTHGDEASAEQLVCANCAGRLAWLDAFCGDLRRSMRYATAVLTTRRADSDEIGVRFAHLATVLVHLERGEIEQAIQRLDHAVSRSAEDGEPLLAAAQQLTQVRLAMETNGPHAALEQLKHGASIGRKSSLGWFAEQFTLAEADAYLAGGEARKAIAILTRSPHRAAGDASLLLLAKAYRLAGDIPAAEAALDQMPSTSTGDDLVTKVRRCLLLAQLHVERNDIQVAEFLVDRALRAAGIEELRGTVRQADGWLRSFVARDAHLLLRHSVFLGSLGYETAPRTLRQREKSEPADALIVVPLTARETDVLNLLAEYCSNEEIAADLVVSMNTVKTHVRSLFQKLTVTRRADAVRRGRALGLC
jgi:LuxR family transcriptional regulator, maltose regulon positive regulatory protein